VRAERFGGAFLYKPFKVQTLLEHGARNAASGSG
jgi:hypothetical protein